ncbi:MAG: PDZ domain-containing protein, partial [Bacillota bacterium]
VGLSITIEIARYYNLPVSRGILITKVADGSPAEAAGIGEGDIILQIDNVELRRIEDLVIEVHKRKVGDSVRVFALSNGRERYFVLAMTEAP